VSSYVLINLRTTIYSLLPRNEHPEFFVILFIYFSDFSILSFSFVHQNGIKIFITLLLLSTKGVLFNDAIFKCSNRSIARPTSFNPAINLSVVLALASSFFLFFTFYRQC